MDYVNVKLINTGDYLLSTYDRGISEKCIEVFADKGVEVLPNYRVTEITKKEIKMRQKSGEEMPLGPEISCIIWAAGIKQNELTTQVKSSLLELNDGVSDGNMAILKTPANGIITDDWLQVRGSGGSLFALGDAASVRHERTLPYAEQLFKAADLDNSGDLTLTELRDLFQGASDEFPQLEEYAQYLSAVTDDASNPRVNAIAKVFGEALERERQAWKKAKALVSQRASDRTKKKGTPDVEKDFAEADEDSNRVFDMEERQFDGSCSGVQRIAGAYRRESAALPTYSAGSSTTRQIFVHWPILEVVRQLLICHSAELEKSGPGGLGLAAGRDLRKGHLPNRLRRGLDC
eukprot:s1378_g14.t1